EWLVGDIFTEAEWKRWWESTKKALKASGAFSIPVKKTDPIQIRREGISHADELIAAFNKARQPKEQIAALEQIIKSYQQFRHPELRTMPGRSVREHSATGEMLTWLCSEREHWNELVTPDLLGAILAALEREKHNAPGRASKLHRALVEDRRLLGDIFKNADIALARDAMRRLQLSPLFDELTKRSLLARVVKVYPELESMITG